MATYLAIGRIQTSDEKKNMPAERIFLLLENAGGKMQERFFSFPLCSNFVYTRSIIVSMYYPTLHPFILSSVLIWNNNIPSYVLCIIYLV
jgi:hypothetical protein